MLKYFYIFLCALICRDLAAFGVQPALVSVGDRLAQHVVTTGAFDPTMTQARANQDRIKFDSSAVRDTSGARPAVTDSSGLRAQAKQKRADTDSLAALDTVKVRRTASKAFDSTAAKTRAVQSQAALDSLTSRRNTMRTSRADSLPFPTATPQPNAAHLSEESPAPETDTTSALPQLADTAMAEQGALLQAPRESAVARTDSTGKSAVAEPAIEMLPQRLSEEAKSAEENILHQFEGLTGIFTLPKILLTLIVILLTYFMARVITGFLTRVSTRRARLAPKARTVIPVVSFGLWFLAAYVIIVGIFARSPLALVLIMAVLALAFFFASRRLLQDLVGGLVILFERPFQIGDRIRIGGQYGEVMKIGLRSFRLLASDGSFVVVPNAEIIHTAIANTNPGKTESLVVAELLLPASIDAQVAAKIAFEAAAVSPYVYIKKPIKVQIQEEFKSELLTKLVVKAYVFDARYEDELRSHIITQTRKGLHGQTEG